MPDMDSVPTWLRMTLGTAVPVELVSDFLFVRDRFNRGRNTA